MWCWPCCGGSPSGPQPPTVAKQVRQIESYDPSLFRLRGKSLDLTAVGGLPVSVKRKVAEDRDGNWSKMNNLGGNRTMAGRSHFVSKRTVERSEEHTSELQSRQYLV